MSTNDNIMFTKDVMKILRYNAMSAFIQFWQDKDNNFPQPFKIGRRHTWYTNDVQSWLDEQRNKALQQ